MCMKSVIFGVIYYDYTNKSLDSMVSFEKPSHLLIKYGFNVLDQMKQIEFP